MQGVLDIAIKGAIEAGDAIMDIYTADTIDYEKKSDHSPLTLADKKSHEIILKKLKETDINVLSEESDEISYDDRKDWGSYWLVDPLDGTKEFIKKNGEFTVNIALIENNIPTLGVVYCPVTKILFWNDVERKVYKKENNKVVEIRKRASVNDNDKNLRVVVSRSHINDETNNYIKKLNEPKLISCGSSLKFLYIADNKADIYPRFGPTMEWDTAAAHSILSALGIQVINLDTGRELSYNKENLLNPYFIIKP
ncbi:MAG: 3'(2'),5'-bisphosphate nucleotidase [Flammeovirgaceae bacterium]|nr:3'(2'),5'-bisphosphate nucleotidase [Flammeovirgaceae bacterium]